MRTPRFVLGGVVLLLAAQAVAAGEKTAVQLRMRQGDVYVFQYDAADQQQIRVTAPDHAPKEFAQTVTSKTKGRFEVLAAERGVPTSMRIAFDGQDCATQVAPAGQPAQVAPFLLAGKTVTVSWEPNGMLRHDVAAPLDAGIVLTFSEILACFGPYFPSQPVGVGDEWDADLPALARSYQLGPNERGSMHCKLYKVSAPQEGEPAAAFVIANLSVTKQLSPTLQAAIEGNAMARFELGMGTLSVTLKGKSQVRGAEQVPGQLGQPVAIQLESSGIVELKNDLVFVQNVAGGGATRVAPTAPAQPTAPTQPPLPTAAPAGALDPFVGTFKDERLTIQIQKDQGGGLTGTILRGGRQFPFKAQIVGGSLQGSFESEGNPYTFTATLQGDILTLTSGRMTYQLKRRPANPLDDEPDPGNPLDPAQPGM